MHLFRMNHRLLHLAILTSHLHTSLGAIITLSTIVEVTKTLAPGEKPPTTAKPYQESTATAEEHTAHPTSTDSAQSHKTDAAPPPAPPSVTAATAIPNTSLAPTSTGHSTLASAATTSAPPLNLLSPATESPASHFSLPSSTPSDNTGSTDNKSAIIGGASAAGAVLIALVAAAYFWWRRRQRRQDTAKRKSISISKPINTLRQSIIKPKFMTNKGKTSDVASITSFSPRKSMSVNPMSISEPLPHTRHDTLMNISKGPYEATSHSSTSLPPPLQPMPTRSKPGYIHGSPDALAVVEEYMSNNEDAHHGDNFPYERTSQYNQGYPITRAPPPPRPLRDERFQKSPRSPPTRSLTAHRSDITTFPDGYDPHSSIHGALGSASYVPPLRPNMKNSNNNNNSQYGNRQSVESEYTDVHYDPDYRSTRFPYPS